MYPVVEFLNQSIPFTITFFAINFKKAFNSTILRLQAEHPRPQYLSRLRKVENKKFNVVHRVLEPHVPFWKVKFPMYVMSFSVIFLFVS